MPLTRKPLITKIHLGPKLVNTDPDRDTAKRLGDAMPYINDSSKNFARSLIENCSMYGWSDKQRHWAGVLLEQAREAYRAARHAARALEGERSAAQLNDLLDGRRPVASATAQPAAVSNPAMARILALFVAAAEHKGKRAPQLLVRVDGRVARLKAGKEGGYVLFWTDVEGGAGYLASVAVTGIVRAKDARIASHVAAALNRFADPAAAARMFGAETSTCMCCGRGLDHPVSVKYGIGPICNARWGVYPMGEYVMPKGAKVGG
jgi:hypothetical protein